MRENPLGGKAGHADQEVQTRADRDDAAADRSKRRERKNHPTSLQRSRDHNADVLPLAKGVRRAEDGPGEATEGTGEGERQVETAGPGAGSRQTDHGGKSGDEVTQAILALAVKYGRYGYRRITVLLKSAGWQVGKDRVQRIWRREGLQVPHKQRPRGRLWLHDGSCIRLRPERANHVWSYDFVKAMTHDGRALRILVLIDEYTRESLTLRVARRLGSLQVIDTLADVILVRGIP